MDCCNKSSIGSKQVINVCDGAILGYVTDIEFDTCDGRITAIIVGECSTLGFSKGENFRVPWCNIKCFGEDTVLVELPPDACKCNNKNEEKKRKNGLFK